MKSASVLGHHLSRISVSGGGKPLPRAFQQKAETAFGRSFSDVRVHEGEEAPALGAKAFTRGSHIHFAPGRFRPESREGQKLLGHELAHVLQQRSGRVRTRPGAGPVNDDAGLEREADQLGSRLALGRTPVTPRPGPSVPAPAAGPAAPAPAAPAIQCALNVQLDGSISGTSLGRRLARTMQTHNVAEAADQNTQADIHAQMEHLDTVEHEIYGWFDRTKNNENHPARASMFQLMDQVQTHHRDLIRRTVAGGHQLWVHGDVTPRERNDIDAIWARTQTNAGNLSVDPNVFDNTGNQYQLPQGEYDDLQTGHLSDMARLMSRPRGRRLVQQLNASGGNNPNKRVRFQMHALTNLMGQGLGPPQITPKAINTHANALIRNQNGRNEQGVGSGALVQITPGLNDSDMSDFSHAGRRVVSPTFVGLGHELVHAAHYQRGTYLPGNNRANAVPNIGDYHGDLEEYAAVERTLDQRSDARGDRRRAAPRLQGPGGQFPMERLLNWNQGIPTENDIREEHGISLRHGHESMATPEVHAGSQRNQDPSTYITGPLQVGTRIHNAQQAALNPPPVIPAQQPGGLRRLWNWLWS